MAQITICDVKACGDIIKTTSEIKNTSIAGTNYQLCKKCHDGLLQFIDDNLIKPNVSLITTGERIGEYVRDITLGRSLAPTPNIQSPFYGGFTITSSSTIPIQIPTQFELTSTNDVEDK